MARLHVLAVEAMVAYDEARKRWDIKETYGPSLLTYMPKLDGPMLETDSEATVRQEWLKREEVEEFIHVHAMSEMLHEIGVEEPYIGKLERKC